MEKSRVVIVEECVEALAACWQHYVDQTLPERVKSNLFRILSKSLPRDFTIQKWSDYADEYEAYVASEKDQS